MPFLSFCNFTPSSFLTAGIGVGGIGNRTESKKPSPCNKLIIEAEHHCEPVTLIIVIQDRGLRKRVEKRKKKDMKLKVYADRMSQPSRAVIIFCKVNGIDFEEIRVDLTKRQQLSSEFKEINPMKKVPAIVDGRFKLFESHAILIYLACAFPGIADHWYPADLSKRAKIHSVLDWHHSNLRAGAAWFVLNSKLAPALGLPLNPQAAAEAEKLLLSSLSKIECFWLKGSGRFLLGGNQPSIADLSLVCELMQLEVLDEKDHNRILSSHKKVLQWIEDTKHATAPHFDEVHKILFKVKARLQTRASSNSDNDSGLNTGFRSKM